MLDAFWAAPPVTRTLTAAVLLVSCAVYGNLLAGSRIMFAWPFLWKFPPEIWRFFTAFFLSGPQLAIIFDPYFIWQYGGSLETDSPRFTRPGDFFFYIMFVGTVILAWWEGPMSNPRDLLRFAFGGFGSLHIFTQLQNIVYFANFILARCLYTQACCFVCWGRTDIRKANSSKLLAQQLLGAVIFTPALITAIAYTYAQDNRGKKIKFIIITMDVKYLPYASCFLNFIINGVYSTEIMAVGIPAAHLYDFLTRLWPAFGGGSNLLKTPAFVVRWFLGDTGSDRVVVKKHGTVFRPPTQATTTSYSAGWGARGRGHRLGGE